VLQRSTGLGPKPWYLAHAATAVALTIGLAALIAGYWLQFEGGHEITRIPDVRVTLPLLAVAVGPSRSAGASRTGRSRC